MAMLKFKKGLWSKLPETKVEGTIYVTTDEKAMYVDISGSERIRLGDIIRVNTFNELQPPFSNEAFYYVEASNALLKRVAVTGENSEVTYEWKQINSTQELTNRLIVVENQVATNKSDISTLKTDVSTLKTDVSDLKTTVGGEESGLVKDVADLKAAIGMDQSGSASGIGSTVAQLVKDLDTLEGTVETQGNTISQHTDKISALETASATYALKTDVSAAKTAILGKADGGADFNGTVKGAYEKADAAKTQADKGVADAATAQTKADANEQAISGLTSRVTALDNAATGEVPLLKARVQTLENAGYATTDQVNTAKNEVLGTASDDAGVATVHGALKSAAAAKAAADAADSKAAAAQNKANQAYTLAESKTTAAEVKTQIEAYGYATTGEVATAKKQAIEAAKTAGDLAYAAKSIEGTVSSHENYITNTLKGDVNVEGSVANAKKAGTDALTLIGNADSGLTKTINSHTAALEILNGADTVNGSVANAKKVGTAAATQAETNRQNIASLTATVNKLDGDVQTDGSVKKQIKDATDTLKTVLSAEIDADIRAANAMEYVGTIESASDIPASGVKNGATYVIGTSFGSYAAGDMLIAQGDENPDTGLIANPTWTHVKSGYDASLDQQLTGANNKIMLSNGVRNDEDAAGAITFAATGSASVEVKNNTVTIGMIWEDFD